MRCATPLLILIFTSCCLPPQDDDLAGPCDPPPQDWFSLEIHDEQGRNLLESNYPPDSLLLHYLGDTIPTWPTADKTRLAIPFTHLKPETAYFLQLSAVDRDTLQVNWKSYGDTCISYELDKLFYNQRLALESSGLSAIAEK